MSASRPYRVLIYKCVVLFLQIKSQAVRTNLSLHPPDPSIEASTASYIRERGGEGGKSLRAEDSLISAPILSTRPPTPQPGLHPLNSAPTPQSGLHPLNLAPIPSTWPPVRLVLPTYNNLPCFAGTHGRGLQAGLYTIGL